LIDLLKWCKIGVYDRYPKNMTTHTKRKKVNFMVDTRVITMMAEFLPTGMRSDFVNEALSEALIKFKKKKACEGIAGLKLDIKNEEIFELKNYGR